MTFELSPKEKYVLWDDMTVGEEDVPRQGISSTKYGGHKEHNVLGEIQGIWAQPWKEYLGREGEGGEWRAGCQT